MGYSIELKSGPVTEGDAGAISSYVYTISRSNFASAEQLVWAVRATDPYTSNNRSVNAEDFVGNIFPTGTLNFLAGESSKDLTFYVNGDNTDEFDRQIFNVGIANSATYLEGVIFDDDDVSSIISAESPIFEVNSSIRTWIMIDGGDTYRMDLQSGITYSIRTFKIEGDSLYWGHFEVMDAWGSKIVNYASIDGNSTFTPTNSGMYFVKFVRDYNHGGIEATLTTQGVISSPNNISLGETSGSGILVGYNDSNVIGNLLSNDLIGNSGNNLLQGLAGDDYIDGRNGSDTMVGGTGRDIYVVGSTADIVTELPGEGVDLIKSSITLSLVDTDGAGTNGGNVEKLTLTGTSAINGTGNGLTNMLTGNSAANTLKGLAGTDTLVGGGGNDKLYGGTGNDTLTGGAGSDKFVFDTTRNGSSNIDTIKGFTHRSDKIVLDDDFFTLGITGTNAGVALSAGKFYVGTAAHDTSDRIIYDQSSGELYYDADGTGSTAQVQFALLGTATHPMLSASNFLIVA